MNKIRMAVQYDNGDVIEQDNCTITMNIMPTAEEYKNLGMLRSMLNYSAFISGADSGNSSNVARSVAIQYSSFTKRTATILNTPTLLLYDSVDNKYFKVGYIQKHINCIGYAESITAFSGSDQKRGTINLQETKFYTKATNRTVNKLVFDFPTHVANGKIDTIVFSPFQFTSTVTYSGENAYVKYQLGLLNFKPKFLSPCSDGYAVNPTSLSSLALNATNSLMYVAENTYVYVMNMNFPNTERFENPYFSSSGLILNKNGEIFYKKSKLLSSNEAIKLQVIGSDLVTTASELNLNIIDKNNDSAWSSSTICAGYFEHTNIKVLVFLDASSSSSYQNISVQIFDMNDNFIKKYTVKKSASQYMSANMNVYNDFLFINIPGISLYFVVSLTNLEITETSLITHAYITSNKAGDLFGGYIKMTEFGDNGRGTTATYLGSLEIDNQGIRIDLAEPIYKNNSQTMKLIFDLDITIE